MINIAFITDSNFVMQTYIAILSLLNTKNKDSIYNIYIIANGLSVTEKDKFLKLSIDRFCINIIDYNIEDTNIKNSYYSNNVFIKLYLDSLIPNCNKLLYLDSDIIIRKDLSELYNIDISNYYIAAVKDIGPTIVHAKSTNTYYPQYFNCGIILLNINNIKKDMFFTSALNYYKNSNFNYLYAEQDLLNNLCNINKKIKILHPKFNWITSNWRYTKKQLMSFYDIKNSNEISDNNIFILHYAGGCRPWIYNNVFYSDIWMKYYNKSIYKEQKLQLKNIFAIKFLIFIKTQILVCLNKKIYKQCKIIG